jgi:hypothetical protein
MADCGDDVFAEGKNNWGEQIRCLKIEINGLRTEIQGATRDQGSFNSKLGDSFNLYKSIGASVNSLKKDMKEFTKDNQRQYDLGEKIAKSYKQASLNIGLSVGKSSEFNNVFKKSVAEIAKFGGTIEDAQGIYEDFADSSGRVRILGDDEVSNIFQLSKAANLVGSEAASLYETLDLMGVSNVDATERLEQLVIDSQSVGLNSSKVVKTLSNNMNKMQTYSFSSGVKGMTKMAKLAVSMRMDVGEMLGMADKFYKPEAAIEAAANLQMLGGDIANAFGDPFETMYLARNKPEELAEKVSSMVEGMMTLNEETGQYDFPAEARMQLKAAGDQLGINVDSMIEMTRQSTKISDVKKKLSMTGAFSDKEMEGIANMARMEGGEFKVDMYDEAGNKMSKSIDELNSSDVEMLMKSPQGEEDYMGKMIENSMTTNELLEAINDSFQKAFVGETDLYKLYEKGSEETMVAIREMTTKSTTDVINIMQDTFAGELTKLGVDSVEELDKKMAESIKGMTSFIEGGDKFDIESKNIDLFTDITNFQPSDDKQDKRTDKQIVDGKAEDLLSYPGGERTVTGSFGSLSLDSRDMLLAGDPKKIGGSQTATNTSSEMKVSGTATINVNINSNTDISSNMEGQITNKIIEVYQKIANGGGDVSSVYQAQPSKGSETLYA